MQLDISTSDIFGIEINDILGKEVLKKDWEVTSGTNILQLNLSNQPNGIYFIKLKNAEGIKVIRITKSKN
jgi:hypothetical protein